MAAKHVAEQRSPFIVAPLRVNHDPEIVAREE